MSTLSNPHCPPTLMARHGFVQQSELPVSADTAFAWHERPGAFERLLPPWERVRIIDHSGGIRDGARAELVNYLGPLPVRWIAEHGHYQPGRQFRDVQRQGPFASWEHQHLFRPIGDDRCELIDRIEYELPGGRLGELLGHRFVRRKLEAMFRFRHHRTRHDLAAHARYKEKIPMHIAISGSRGLIGSALTSFLRTGGHRVAPLVRGAADEDSIAWDPNADRLDPLVFDGIDAVVHLAGENIAGRWTKRMKQRIHDSRIRGTTVLSQALAKMETPPKVLVCASAIGFYGDRGDEMLTEQSEKGDGFLADVCSDWEAATQPARDAGIRVVNVRFGMVLSPDGGALAKMLLPFKLGVGGVVGSGRQYWSWISLDDAVGAAHHALMHDSLDGPINVVAPNAPDNREFTKTLGRVLRRPTIFPMPGFAARLAFGQMADELMLASARVEPQLLLSSGYEFREPTLEAALRHLLGR